MQSANSAGGWIIKNLDLWIFGWWIDGGVPKSKVQCPKSKVIVRNREALRRGVYPGRLSFNSTPRTHHLQC
jgi:hypothetical protein